MAILNGHPVGVEFRTPRGEDFNCAGPLAARLIRKRSTSPMLAAPRRTSSFGTTIASMNPANGKTESLRSELRNGASANVGIQTQNSVGLSSMKNIAFFLLLFLLCIAPRVANCQNTSQQDETAEAATTTPDTVAVDNIVDDEKIADRLDRIYNSSGWFSDLEVRVNDGFVSITGRTDKDEHSEWASEIASRTEDVIGVDNRLAVDSRMEFQESMSVVGKSLEKLYRDFLLQLPFVLIGFVTIMATWLSSKIIRWVLSSLLNKQRRLRTSLKDLLLHLATIATWVLGLLLATVVVFPGMTPARALTVLGLGSVAIGFAFKDIFENFFAGILILWRYPFDRGDFIQNGDVVGEVEEITIRNTMIRRTDGELVIIPNGQLFKSNVEVLTNRSRRRVRIMCGVGYGEDLSICRSTILDAVRRCPTVDASGEVQVLANEFADSSINFEIAWWAGASPVEFRKSRDEVIEAVKQALDDAGIEIPFPQRVVKITRQANINSEQ